MKTNNQIIPNRLANEKSPYLLQHENNPVNWYPWSKEAFQIAKTENKPVFLYIGVFLISNIFHLSLVPRNLLTAIMPSYHWSHRQ